LVDTLPFGQKGSAMPKSHPRYPAEFRRKIIELNRVGRKPDDLAREFRIAPQSVRNWIKRAQLDAGERSDGLTSVERDELSRLRRKVKQLEVEREILSKAAAWFARETNAIPSKSSSS